MGPCLVCPPTTAPTEVLWGQPALVCLGAGVQESHGRRGKGD